MNSDLKQKRILVVTGIYPPDIGGPATHLAQFLPYVVAQDTKVEVVTFGTESHHEEREGIEVWRVSRHQGILKRFFQYCRIVYRRAAGADLIYLHDMSLAGLAVLLVRRPYVLRLGGDYVWESAFQAGATDLDYKSFQGHEPRGYRWRRWLGTRIARSASAVIVPSFFLKDVVVEWGVLPGRIEVVPNAVDTDSLSDVPCESEVLTQIAALKRAGKKVVVTSGRFVRRKHFDVAIRAMRQTSGVHLLVIGEGPKEDAYRTLIEECGASDMVSLIPAQPRNALFCILSAADCFLLLDEGETFSFITLEALLAGTPAVLTRAGALEEIFGAYEGKGVTFVSDRTERMVAVQLNEVATLMLPPAAVQEELAEQYSISRHRAAVCATMRDILRV